MPIRPSYKTSRASKTFRARRTGLLLSLLRLWRLFEAVQGQPYTYLLWNAFHSENKWISFADSGKWLYAGLWSPLNKQLKYAVFRDFGGLKTKLGYALGPVPNICIFG